MSGKWSNFLGLYELQEIAMELAWPDSISDEDYSPSLTAKNFLRFSNIPVAQDAEIIMSYRPYTMQAKKGALGVGMEHKPFALTSPEMWPGRL